MSPASSKIETPAASASVADVCRGQYGHASRAPRPRGPDTAPECARGQARCGRPSEPGTAAAENQLVLHRRPDHLHGAHITGASTPTIRAPSGRPRHASVADRERRARLDGRPAARADLLVGPALPRRVAVPTRVGCIGLARRRIALLTRGLTPVTVRGCVLGPRRLRRRLLLRQEPGGPQWTWFLSP
jgi:hypothetical protein